MTRQEKINKVSRFCALQNCASCEGRKICLIRTSGIKWSNAPENMLDDMITAIDKADKPVASTIKNDPVNHPSHYTAGGIECIDALNSMMQGYKALSHGRLSNTSGALRSKATWRRIWARPGFIWTGS